MSEEEYREWGQSVADELHEAAGRGASLQEIMDIVVATKIHPFIMQHKILWKQLEMLRKKTF